MKFLGIILSVVLASQMALAAKKAKHVVVEDEDSDAPVTSVRVRESSRHTSVIRRINAQVGLSVSDVTMQNTSSKTGLLFGATIDLLKYDKLVFETGLQYKQMGTNGTNGVSTNLNYIVIPIAAKYYFLGEAGNTVYGVAGLAPGIAVSRTFSVTNGPSGDLTEANSLDYGFLFGFGGKIMMSDSVGLLLEADYTRGLANILNSSDRITTGGISLNNVGFTFATGVSFEL